MSKKKVEKTGKNLVLIPLLMIVLLDQLIKILVKNSVIDIPFIMNNGSAFGILRGFNLPLIFVSIAFVSLIIYLYDQIPNINILFVSLGLILGGTIGNLIDRIYLGAVIDFINFKFWPLFNIADSAIVVGALTFLWFYLKFEHEEYLRLHKKKR